ncbi:hypothetical protein DVH05_000288 [Phytophthora capsici]|nr:hypothetical protein DVH05_000288 [Phytophthora capsici]
MFDEIYPVFVLPCERFYEAKFVTSGDIDDFVAALPVKEMVDLTHTVMSRELTDEPRTMEEEADIHNYVWMLRWLETSMEISEISRSDFKARMQFYSKTIPDYRVFLDKHVECHIGMETDLSVTEEAIDRHRDQGLRLEKKYNMIVRMMSALDVVDAMADQLKTFTHTWVCKCQKCVYYSSEDWVRDQPCVLEYTTLKSHSKKFWFSRSAGP